MSQYGRVLSPAEIDQRLRDAAIAAFRGDRGALDKACAWLASVTADELLRIDSIARRPYYDRPALGRPQEWKPVALSRHPVAAVLASMHPDGFLREPAVQALIGSNDQLTDRALAMRVCDHVPQISKPATRAILQRTALEQADRIMPLLQRIEHRDRSADIRTTYLNALVAGYGEQQVWERLRASNDRKLHRVAYKHSIDHAILTVDAAAQLLPGEHDAIVRRLLADVVADHAPTDVVARVLLHARSADNRARGLVRLTADELDPHDVERLLTDSSVLVRMWARRRWQQLGHDPTHTYRRITHSTTDPLPLSRAYLGLAETGTRFDRAEALQLVNAQDLPLQKVGLQLLINTATADDVPSLLSTVATAHGRLARLASDVLTANTGLWSADDITDLQTSHDPDLRRRAWSLQRSRGGWDTTLADLQILHDPDPRLIALGKQASPPMYFQPNDRQREQLNELLPHPELVRGRNLAIAHAADLPDLITEIQQSPINEQTWQESNEPTRSSTRNHETHHHSYLGPVMRFVRYIRARWSKSGARARPERH